jgi:hypothetical protein
MIQLDGNTKTFQSHALPVGSDTNGIGKREEASNKLPHQPHSELLQLALLRRVRAPPRVTLRLIK